MTVVVLNFWRLHLVFGRVAENLVIIHVSHVQRWSLKVVAPGLLRHRLRIACKVSFSIEVHTCGGGIFLHQKAVLQ